MNDTDKQIQFVAKFTDDLFVSAVDIIAETDLDNTFSEMDNKRLTQMLFLLLAAASAKLGEIAGLALDKRKRSPTIKDCLELAQVIVKVALILECRKQRLEARQKEAEREG